MKTRLTAISFIIALISIAPLAPPALAVEGGLGRPISGASVNPYAGLVPPAPGFAFSVGETYYEGSIGGGTTVPVNNLLTLGIDMKVSFTPVSLLYIWNTPGKQWNFASAITLPIAWLEAEATVTAGPRTGRITDSTSGLFDLAFTPIVASYHISQTDHIAFSFSFWAPTGEYDSSQLANLSLNNWTFIPGIAYTKIFPESNIELSGTWQMQFYTENPATNYQNGILSDLEFLAVKRFKCGAGFGLIASWIEQLTDDEGTTADRFNGFSGRAFGVGPIFTFSKEIGKQHLDINVRWVHEFENQKRVEGDMFALSASLKF